MVREIPCDAAQSLVLVGWRSAEDGLFLRARGEADEARLQCRCGRCHWIVHEHVDAAGGRLLVTCHNCGTRAAFVLEAPRPRGS